jgi:hypothetical protein
VTAGPTPSPEVCEAVLDGLAAHLAAAAAVLTPSHPLHGVLVHCSRCLAPHSPTLRVVEGQAAKERHPAGSLRHLAAVPPCSGQVTP